MPDRTERELYQQAISGNWSAFDDLRMVATRQFFGADVLTDAVVGAAIGSDAPFGIGVRHGWRRVGEPLMVSSSGGNRVELLDERPALDAYLERLDAPPEAWNQAGVFTRFAQTHPLGLSCRSDEEHVRFVAEADFEKRALVCIAAVPQGGLAWIMEGDSTSVLDATDAACTEALDALGGRPSVYACYRLTAKLRERKPILDACLARLVDGLSADFPSMGRT